MSLSAQSLHELGWNHFFHQQLTLAELETSLPARVISLHGQLVDVISAAGRDTVSMPGTWKQEEADNLPTVGDWLLLERESRQPVRLLERKSVFRRIASGRDARVQLLAANVDTLFIVTSCNRDFNLSRLERYLAMALDAGVDPVLVLTKVDLCDDVGPYLGEAATLRADLVVETVNARDAESVERLRLWCGSGQTVALVGSSGVGKSTIINSLCGEKVQATGDIRETDEKGRHTTTSRSLHFLPGGGLLLDSPGMRELQLGECDEGIAILFDDIEDVAAGCRFRNCRHEGEKGCAVARALEDGLLDPRRVENYLKLRAEQERLSETLAEKRRKERTFGKTVKSVLEEKMKKQDDY